MLLGLTACGSKTETTATETETQTTSVETESVKETKKERPELAEGQMYSYLTGEVVDEAIGSQRPFAIMINNIQDAIPQSGICLLYTSEFLSFRRQMNIPVTLVLTV